MNITSLEPTFMEWYNAGNATLASLKLSGLTAGRVPYVGTAGLLQDSAALTFVGTTLSTGTVEAEEMTALYTITAGSFNTIGAIAGGAITGTSFIIGGNTLNITEFAFLDGQNQSVFTTSSPTFVGLTLSGPVTDTLAAANTTGLNIDGDTNPFVYSSQTNFTFNTVSRKVTGSGVVLLPSAGYGFKRLFTWDYDYSGAGFGTANIFGNSDNMIMSGDINISSGKSVSTILGYGNYSTYTHTGSIINSTALAITTNSKGGYFLTSFIGDFNITGAGVVTANVVGGEFYATGTPTITAGVPVINYIGGKFIAVGTAVGTSTAYAGYFSATGADTNYGLYVVAGTSSLLDAKIGDGGVTNYLNIAANGNVSFVGSAGLYPRTLNQADEPAAGTGATQLDTAEMCVWTDTDDSKCYLCYNHGGTVKTVELV